MKASLWGAEYPPGPIMKFHKIIRIAIHTLRADNALSKFNMDDGILFRKREFPM
jgi:hypothetical protein